MAHPKSVLAYLQHVAETRPSAKAEARLRRAYAKLAREYEGMFDGRPPTSGPASAGLGTDGPG